MRTEKATFTNLCMIQDGTKVLTINRNSKNCPGIAFPGGHVDPEESFVESVIREVREETGLIIRKPRLVGIKQFITKKVGRYTVFLYKAEDYTGSLDASKEGELNWVEMASLKAEALSDGMEEMIQVFTGQYSEVYYEEDVEGWSVMLK